MKFYIICTCISSKVVIIPTLLSLALLFTEICAFIQTVCYNFTVFLQLKGIKRLYKDSFINHLHMYAQKTKGLEYSEEYTVLGQKGIAL